MTDILDFDTRNGRDLHDAALAALQETAKAFGLTVAKAGGSLDGLKATLKFEFKVADKAATDAGEVKEFASLCTLYGLTAAHYKATFASNGQMFELFGFAPQRPKFCLKARNLASGKVMLFPDSMKTRLKITAAA